MNGKFREYLARIAKRINLVEGASGIKQVIIELHRHGKMSLRNLAKSTRMAPPIVSLIINKLCDDGLLYRDKNGILFTESGMMYTEQQAGIRSLPVQDCIPCKGTGLEIDVRGMHQGLKKALETLAATRPSADVTLDQAKCTPGTMLSRLLLLHAWHALDGTDIMFLGDDDFMSIACCLEEFRQDYFIPLNEQDDLPFSISVLEIDGRIRDGINAKYQHLRDDPSAIIALKYDARNPLPLKFRYQHDVGFIDPPYTLAGFTLFFSRIAAALRNEKGSKLFVSFGHVDSDLTRQMQEIMINSGFLLEQVIPGFNKYEGGNIIGNQSRIMVLVASGDIKPPIPPGEGYAGVLYTNDFKSTTST
ncbi:putative methyltransferase [Candidatus Bathyarchaeota archaeon]|nr:putative methyltransferase [Candidatus Bathyarchaeota archaeon]